jgi:hypothetical protein
MGSPGWKYLDDIESDLGEPKTNMWRQTANNRYEWESVLKDARIRREV